jgi:hypothetical protein
MTGPHETPLARGLPMPTSRATVETERADRYVKQLVSHLGRKAAVVRDGDGHRLMLSTGTCTVTAYPSKIELTATADSDHALRTVEGVVARHLERFGQRDRLNVVWTPSSRSD